MGEGRAQRGKKAIETVLAKVEEDIGEMQQCVKGLIEEVSEKVALDVGVGLLVPDKIEAIIYVAVNYTGLATGKVPPSYELEQFCQPEEEEEGSCFGTILIVICLGLGIMISMIQKRGGRYEF